MDVLGQVEGNRSVVLPDGVIDLARVQAAATVYEAAGQQGAMDAGIHSVAGGMRLCGRALTVRCQPADNLTLHAAVAAARPGDIIVADVGNFLEAGHWGEILTVAAQARGIGGLVINGGVRDIEAAQRHGFPVFARAVSMKSTVKRVLGDINIPILCGNVSISPGDLILADDDGIVAVPAGQVEQVLRAAIERENREAEVMDRLKNGELTLDILGFRELLPEDIAQTGRSTHVG